MKKRFSMKVSDQYFLTESREWAQIPSLYISRVPNTLNKVFFKSKLDTFLYLHQEDTSLLFTQEGNINKSCNLPPDTYIGIIYVPSHPGYILRGLSPPWNHPLLCNDIHLYGADVFPHSRKTLISAQVLFLEQ